MTRREILAAVELAMAASALSAAVYGLVRASYNPYAAVQWVPIAIVGCGTALALVGLAAVLFVGRTALLLSADMVRARRWRRMAPPSSARHRVPVASMPAPTVWFTAEELAAYGRQPAGGAR